MNNRCRNHSHLEKVKVQNRTEAKSSQFLKLFQKAQLLSHSRARHSSSGAKMNNKSGKQSKEDELCAESTTTSLTRLPEPGTAATIRLGWILSGPRPDPTKVNTSEILQHSSDVTPASIFIWFPNHFDYSPNLKLEPCANKEGHKGARGDTAKDKLNSRRSIKERFCVAMNI